MINLNYITVKSRQWNCHEILGRVEFSPAGSNITDILGPEDYFYTRTKYFRHF